MTLCARLNRNSTQAKLICGRVHKSLTKKELNILKDELDDEILEKMPEWFKRLRQAYHKNINSRRDLH